MHTLDMKHNINQMKFGLVSIIFLIIPSAFGQQWQLGAGLSSHIPNKLSMPQMNVSGGLNLSLAYSPFYRSPFYVEYQPSWENYSYKCLDQTYQFDDGSQTITAVTYKSSISRHLLGIKSMLGGDFRMVRGFLTPQIGLMSYSSKIIIADPNDTDGCQALDRKTTHRFTGAAYGGQIGLELDLGRIFPNKFQVEQTHKLVLTASYEKGFNHAEYVNIKYMEDAVHSAHVTHDDRDINAQFINVSTAAIHEHKVAEVYHSPAEYLGFSIGYRIQF